MQNASNGVSHMLSTQAMLGIAVVIFITIINVDMMLMIRSKREHCH